MNTVELSNQVLEKARNTYGDKNQILVCIEELNELACALAKYPRYDSKPRALEETREKVLDEVADVLIILNHVQAIFEFDDDEVNEHVLTKLTRVGRWLSTSTSMEQTTIDRGTIRSESDYHNERIRQEEEVDAKSCKLCLSGDDLGADECDTCNSYSNFKPIPKTER